MPQSSITVSEMTQKQLTIYLFFAATVIRLEMRYLSISKILCK